MRRRLVVRIRRFGPKLAGSPGTSAVAIDPDLIGINTV
jgi:hypothetical protein